MSGPKAVALTIAPATIAAAAGGVIVAGVVIYAIAKQVQKARRESLRAKLRDFAAQLDELAELEACKAAQISTDDNAVLEQAVIQSRDRIAQVRADLAQRFHRMLSLKEDLLHRQERARITADRILPSAWPEEECSRVRRQMDAEISRILDIPPLPSNLSKKGILQLRRAEEARDQFFSSMSQIEQNVQEEAQKIHKRMLEAKMAASRTPPRKLADILSEIQKESPAPPINPIPEKLEKLLQQAVSLQASGCWHDLLLQISRIQLEKDSERQRLLYNNVVIGCSKQIKLQKQHEKWRSKLAALLARARAFEDVPTFAFVSDLENLLRAGVVCDLTPHCEKLEVFEKNEKEIKLQREKRRAICESLQTLGYLVNEGEMITVLAEKGKMVLKKAPDAEYGVEIVSNQDTSILQTAMIRFAENADMSEQQRMRDMGEEKAWCQEHSRFLDDLKKQGIQSGYKVKLSPGQHPVKIILGKDRSAARVSHMNPKPQANRNTEKL